MSKISKLIASSRTPNRFRFLHRRPSMQNLCRSLQRKLMQVRSKRNKTAATLPPQTRMASSTSAPWTPSINKAAIQTSQANRTWTKICTQLSMNLMKMPRHPTHLESLQKLRARSPVARECRSNCLSFTMRVRWAPSTRKSLSRTTRWLLTSKSSRCPTSSASMAT